MSLNFDDVIKDLEQRFNLHVEVETKEPTEETGHIVHVTDDLLASEADDFREIGKAGIYYQSGLATYKDRNTLFHPVKARGLRYDQGNFWQWFITNADFRTGINDIVTALQDGDWSIDYNVPIPHYLKPVAEQQLHFARSLFDFQSIETAQTLREGMYCAIGGFSLFEKVYHVDGTVRLEFRFPHQVEKWIVDHKGRLLGVKLVDIDQVLPASKLLLITNDRYGNDFEGIGLMRTVGLLIRFQQELLSTAGKVFYAHGMPWLFFVPKDKDLVADATNDNLLIQSVGVANGSTRPVWRLNGPYDIVQITANGVMPDVMPLVKYLDEKIAKIIKSEGSLIGFNNRGAYNALEQKDQEHLRNARKWGTFLSRHLNQVIQDACKRRFALPVLNDCWPVLNFGLGLEERLSVDDLIKLQDKGWIEQTPEAIKKVQGWYNFEQD